MCQLCLDLSGKKRPKAFETRAGTSFAVIILKRHQPKSDTEIR